MKHIISTFIIVAMTCNCVAATITKGTIQHKLSNKDTCTTGVCATTLKISLKTSIEGTLTPGEVNEFSPNSRIQGNFPVGPTITFRLSDDPNYTNGETSIKISKTTVFNNVAWKHNISMSWNGGVLKLKVTIGANQKLNNFYPMVWDGLDKTKTQNQSEGEGLLSLLADNFGTPFLDVKANTANTVLTKSSTQSKSGQTKLSSSQSIKGQALPFN